MTVFNVDCRDGMRWFPEATFDAIVCDPPYELGFMGKHWDRSGISNDVEVWREALRVLKPGGHLLAFSGSRTYHRMTCAIENAGFEIRDQIMWIYGSGFPKSHNLGTGWGTALKPAHEPVCVARKPIVGTVAANVRQFGTGAINIDGCRIPTSEALSGSRNPSKNAGGTYEQNALGRWPANVIHDGSDDVLAAFPDAAGQLAKAAEGGARRKDQNVYGGMVRGSNGAEPRVESDRSAARFFYCAKASRKDRNEGLDDPGPQFKHGALLSKVENTATTGNNHPTVKPTELMRYLCRLVTPPGGSILDPFAGSGSTGKAAALEGFAFVGFELDPAYAEIANARIAAA